MRAPAAEYASASGENDVLGRRALLALRDVEGHLLAFEQLAEALGGDVRVVGEHVGAATVLLDEAEALFRVEPLHGTSSHVISPLGQCLGVHTARTPCRRDDHPARKKSRKCKSASSGTKADRRALEVSGTTTATEIDSSTPQWPVYG